MAQVQNPTTLDADAATLLNPGAANVGPDGVCFTFTITGTNSLVLSKNTAPPGSTPVLVDVAYLNGSLALQSAGTAITATGLAYVSPDDAALDLWATLNWTSGAVVSFASAANLGAGGGGGSGGPVSAGDVTAGTFGQFTGSTGDYAFPDDVVVADDLTANDLIGVATVQGGAITGTTGVFSGALSNTATTASLAQSTTTAQVNVGTGTGSGATALMVRGAAALNRTLEFQTASTSRWAFLVNNTAESGSDAGSDFALLARTDAGAAIDSPITITRATGGFITLARGLRSAFGALFSSPTLGIGYTTGAGGAQTQLTNKQTTVVSDTITTAITMNAEALNLLTTTAFTFTNATIAATDTVICTHQSAGTSAAYTINAFPGAGSAVISVRNNTAGSLSEAIVIRVTVIKSVSA